MLNDKCDTELIEAAGDKLKVVSSYSAGCEFERLHHTNKLTYRMTVDHVDLESLRSRKIRLGYTPSALTDAVADLAVMLALMAQRLGGEVR